MSAIFIECCWTHFILSLVMNKIVSKIVLFCQKYCCNKQGGQHGVYSRIISLLKRKQSGHCEIVRKCVPDWLRSDGNWELVCRQFEHILKHVIE